MTSLAVKRTIAGVVGSAYAVIYGFWTMIVTGGGHVNFIWLWLFVTVGLFGLYFPLMALLVIDLRSRLKKLIFGSFIVFHLLASTIMILGWVMEPPTDRPESDFVHTIRVQGAEVILICGSLHFLPTVVFAFFLVRSIIRGEYNPEEEPFVNLKLT